VPRVIEELLRTKLVAPPPPGKDTPCPLAVVARWQRGCSVVICTPPPLLESALVVVLEPTRVQVLLVS
jgi:hypothetical protein